MNSIGKGNGISILSLESVSSCLALLAFQCSQVLLDYFLDCVFEQVTKTFLLIVY
jgi:hypothetical protein